MKKIILAFILIASMVMTIQAKENNQIATKSEYRNIGCQLQKYSINVQSSTYYLDGCFFYFTATLEFEWDGVPGHAPTNVTMSNGTLNISCPPIVWDAKGVKTEISVNEDGYINNFVILPTGDNSIDKVVSYDRFRIDFINLCNEYIKKYTNK